MKDLTRSTAVVTGAASGIGRALAARFGRAGMNLVLADVDGSALEVVADELRAAGVDVLARRTDVTDCNDVEAMAAATSEAFGPVHLLCNNAGVGGGGMLPDLTLEDWRRTLDVNLWGVIHGVSVFLPSMLAHGEPAHIVNTASILGHASGAGIAPYAASKFAVVGISETLHHEMAAAGGTIGVSVLCPGLVSTAIFDPEKKRQQRRPVHPADAAMAAILAHAGLSPDAVADLVHDAVTSRRFYVFTHPNLLDVVERRTRAMVEGTDPPEILGLLFGGTADKGSLSQADAT